MPKSNMLGCVLTLQDNRKCRQFANKFAKKFDFPTPKCFLKDTYAYYQVLILFGVNTRIGLHALMLKINRFSHTVWCCSSVSPLCLKRSVLAPVAPLLNSQSVLIGQLTRAWASTTNNNRAAVLNQFLRAKLAASNILCSSVCSRWCSVVSQSHLIKGGKHFRSSVSLWESSFCWCGLL